LEENKRVSDIMIPYVILFNAMSVDGRLDFLETESSIYYLYYELASQWQTDAVLMGSETILKGFNATNGEIRGNAKEVREKRDKFSPDNRPLLVVPDSKGSVGVWAEVLEMPYIKDVVVLCSKSTPPEYTDFLENNEIEYLVSGKDRVELKEALEELNKNFDVEIVRVDSGGTLNGALLREGLVDEIRLLINPCLIGGITPSSIFQASDLKSVKNVINLELIEMEKMRDDIVHLRYQIIKKD